MNAIVITIGDEILLGQILDTNSRYIAEHLTAIGVEVKEMLTVGDKQDEMYGGLCDGRSRTSGGNGGIGTYKR